MAFLVANHTRITIIGILPTLYPANVTMGLMPDSVAWQIIEYVHGVIRVIFCASCVIMHRCWSFCVPDLLSRAMLCVHSNRSAHVSALLSRAMLDTIVQTKNGTHPPDKKQHALNKCRA